VTSASSGGSMGRHASDTSDAAESDDWPPLTHDEVCHVPLA
jgi:hypothetical protein